MTALNSGWFTQVLNQRTTLPKGLRKSLSMTNFMGYTRAETTQMSARETWREKGEKRKKV